MTSHEDGIKAYLAEHPRMIGALFTMMLLLSQASAVAATKASGTKGP